MIKLLYTQNCLSEVTLIRRKLSFEKRALCVTRSSSQYIDREIEASGDTATDIINRAIQVYAWFMRTSAKAGLVYVRNEQQVIVPEIRESLTVKFVVNLTDKSLSELASFQVEEGDYFLSCALETYRQVQQGGGDVVHVAYPMTRGLERVTLL